METVAPVSSSIFTGCRSDYQLGFVMFVTHNIHPILRITGLLVALEHCFAALNEYALNRGFTC